MDNNQSPPNGQLASPRPGTRAGNKRQASENFSPNAIRRRARRESMTDAERTLERAILADRQAVFCARRKLKSSEAYKKASDQEKKQLFEQVKKDVLARRTLDKRSAEYISQQLRGNGAQAQSTQQGGGDRDDKVITEQKPVKDNSPQAQQDEGGKGEDVILKDKAIDGPQQEALQDSEDESKGDGDSRVATLETIMSAMESRMSAMETRLGAIEARLRSLETRVRV